MKSGMVQVRYWPRELALVNRARYWPPVIGLNRTLSTKKTRLKLTKPFVTRRNKVP